MNDIFETYELKHGATMQSRIALAPMTTYSSNPDLTLSDEEETYYNARAKEFGMVITAATAVSKNAQAFDNQISIRDERYLESMRRLATAINKEGSRSVLQIHHGGRMNKPGLYPNQDIVSASAVKAERPYAQTPRKLRTSEIYDIIDDFANATRLAILAGFDGVELHGANTYLIQQFFSPHSNRRDDEFGGSVERRLKFPLTLVDRVLAVKKQYGKDDFIVGYRLSPEELEEPGITLADTMILVDHLAARDLDYIHLSQGNFRNRSLRDKTDTEPIITKVKRVVGDRTAIIGAGGIDSLDDIEEALALGYDLVALGTIALSDAKIVTHLKEGVTPSRVFDETSLLPSPLFERLKSWRGLSDKGYSFK